MSAPAPEIMICGVRHHGPGSARSIETALNAFAPDYILVEGPPEASDIATLVAANEVRFPVALMVYQQDHIERSLYFPFAEYSPEMRAIRYAAQHAVSLEFIDLPVGQLMGLVDEEQTDLTEFLQRNRLESDDISPEALAVQQDPLGTLANVAGFSDGERWWEHLIERRGNVADVFPAVMEGMQALREVAGDMIDDFTRLREASMRRQLRRVMTSGAQRILVVCGAWHAPALQTMPPASEDNELLKGLTRHKVAAAWIPWTQRRLAVHQGYGAGVQMPAWYQHLWEYPRQVVVSRWMSQMAGVLRQLDMPTSSAEVIDAVRLAEGLAALRGYESPGLEEIHEAALSIMCQGDDHLLAQVVTSMANLEQVGELPHDLASTPLMADIAAQQKRLRLPVEYEANEVRLNLREPRHREKSYFMHRLLLLGIYWAELLPEPNQQGTFNELWRLSWTPNTVIQVIEASHWGNTAYDATTQYTKHLLERMMELGDIIHMLNHAMMAALPDTIEYAIDRIEARSALANDVGELMAALPALVDVLLYGTVRSHDTSLLQTVIDRLVARVCAGLIAGALMLEDEAADIYFQRMRKFDNAIRTMNRNIPLWEKALLDLIGEAHAHAKLRGYACRILYESGRLSPEEVASEMRMALGIVNDPIDIVTWLEGFLSGSGALLLHQATLLALLDEWITELNADTFNEILPLLRRTFSYFPEQERVQLWHKIFGEATPPDKKEAANPHFSFEQADKHLPELARWLPWLFSDDTSSGR